MARMAKHSRFEELDQVVNSLLLHPDAALPADPRLASLARIAAQFTTLPRPDFRARLKSDLKGKSSMTTATETVTRVRQTAAPRLRINNASAAIEFYKKAFGARENLRFENELGLPHAEIQIGNAVIFLADESPDYGMPGPLALGGSPVSIELFVEDSDALVAQAVAAGATLTAQVEDQFYGYRSGKVTDPFGYTWTIATVKEEISVEEMHRRFEPIRQQMMKKPSVDPIPKGYRTVTPYLVAEDGPALLEFVKQVFGAEEVFRTVGSAGGLHSEARIGDSMLMIGGGIPGRELRSTANTTALHVYVKDVDAVYHKALASGATSISAPRDQEYGERGGAVKDAAGNYWYIATHIGARHVPDRLNSVNVYLHPLRGEPVINFMKRAFGAEELARYASPEGVIHHAEIRVGSSVVELGEANGPYQPMPSMFYLYVSDCDQVYQRALQAGATSISEPVDQAYGDRSAGVKDAFGNQWHIATHIKDVTN